MKKLFLLFGLALCYFWGGSVKAQTPGAAPIYIVIKLKATTGTQAIATQQRQPAAPLPQLQALLPPQATLAPALPGLRQANQRSAPTRAGLERMYKIRVAPHQAKGLLQQLRQQPYVAYAEVYVPAPRLAPPRQNVPNDPEAQPGSGSQNYLSTIKAYEAWAITTGSASQTLAIVDSGIEFAHPDLTNQLFTNPNDPINGIDDDADGFVDNFNGYDLADNDAVPEADFDEHGTSVAGMSSATPNNGFGMAGTGYNTRLMPVKIYTSADDTFVNGYEAIAYAANQGAQVINLSWGGVVPYSQYVADIIAYAALEQDAVIVAAAGNTPAELDFYPASYPYVLSVTSTDLNDQKSGFATYSPFVDLTAPGNQVFGLVNGQGFGSLIGTSFAAPQVAGAASLLRHHLPTLNSLQVAQRLRRSANPIDGVVGNSAFAERLGQGRLDMEAALQSGGLQAVRLYNTQIEAPQPGFYFYNDTLQIGGTLLNVLDPVQNLSVSVSGNEGFATVLQSSFGTTTGGTMDTLAQENNFIRVALGPNTPPDSSLLLRLGYTDATGYTDYQYLRLNTAPSNLPVPANGGLTPVANQAAKTSSLLYSSFGNLLPRSGLLVAVSQDSVYSGWPVLNTQGFEQDFTVEQPVKYFSNSTATTRVQGQVAAGWLKVNHEHLAGQHLAGQHLAGQQDSTQDNQQLAWAINTYRFSNNSTQASTDSLLTGLWQPQPV